MSDKTNERAEENTEEFPIQNEADFAMLYSEQLRINDQLRARFYALLYETLPFVNAASGLIDSMFDMDVKRTNKFMKALIAWRADMEAVMYINLFAPPSGAEYKAARPPIKEGQVAISDLLSMEQVGDELEPSARNVYREWDELAKELGLHTREQAAKKYAETASEKAAVNIKETRKTSDIAAQLEEFENLLKTADKKPN